MSAILYKQIAEELSQHIDDRVDESSLNRLVLLILGILESKSSKPSQIADALHRLKLSGATAESLERQIRRTENDPEITTAWCFHPFARAHLRAGNPERLILIIDPTTQEDRVVKLTVSVWYRGRALPLAWTLWPGNQKLQGDRFWTRVKQLLAQVAPLLPTDIPIIWLADRAFGTPQFTDLLTPYGWHYVVRVQGQTRCRDRLGRETMIQALVPHKTQRAKLHGQVFKGRGWRAANVVAYWGRGQDTPLCLVTDLDADWDVLRLYRQRYGIEASFRDEKSRGWDFEACQVRDLDHLERLLVGMAFATWFALLTGTQVAAEHLRTPPTSRCSRPWAAKRSLFDLGLSRLRDWLQGHCQQRLGWRLCDWMAPNWSDQLHFRHRRAFVFRSGKVYACL